MIDTRFSIIEVAKSYFFLHKSNNKAYTTKN